MEQVKVVHEASQVAYNTSTALRANLQVSKTLTQLSNVVLYLITHWGVSLLIALKISIPLDLSRILVDCLDSRWVDPGEY